MSNERILELMLWVFVVQGVWLNLGLVVLTVWIVVRPK
jgi:hypothetical protein